MTMTTTQNSSPATKRLLVIEDDYAFYLNLSEALSALGFDVCGYSDSVKGAIREIEEKRPDIVLLDINLGSGGSGINVAHYLSANTNIPYVFLTAYSAADIMSAALATAPYGYVVKPAKPVEVKAALEAALIRYQLETKRKRSFEKHYLKEYTSRKQLWKNLSQSELVNISDASHL
ncbi:MAG: response regulator, partial [Ketobacteraceae bacterium]|nr:response regulator [Ketobacteraceae bacterium]